MSARDDARVPGPPPVPRCPVCGGGPKMMLHKPSCPEANRPRTAPVVSAREDALRLAGVLHSRKVDWHNEGPFVTLPGNDRDQIVATLRALAAELGEYDAVVARIAEALLREHRLAGSTEASIYRLIAAAAERDKLAAENAKLRGIISFVEQGGGSE